ncbi:MAG TPA: hypothetical protein EYP10_08735, partial [Armatimonadetes bacterium]|nr:hypothetical protein [Armatimonadota bacterium]
MDAIVVEVTRNGITEAEHIISAVVVDERAKVMAFWGDSDMRFYWRSSAKPFQALPLLATGAADAFGLTDDEIAIACASHHGSIEHQATIKSMLGKAGLDVNALQCGVHPPMDESERRRLICSDEKPTPLHHNCSGKHAGMLITAKHLGESIDNYRLPEHPVQQCILKLATEFTCYPQLHDTVTSDG